MDHAGDAFFLYDEENRVVDLNQRACESLGYTREELIGKTPLDFDPDITPTFLEDLHREFASGVEHPPFETRHRRKDGTIFPVEVRIQVFFQGTEYSVWPCAGHRPTQAREERLRLPSRTAPAGPGRRGTSAPAPSTPVAAVLSHGMAQCQAVFRGSHKDIDYDGILAIIHPEDCAYVHQSIQECWY